MKPGRTQVPGVITSSICMHSVFNIEQIEQLYYLAQKLAELAVSCNIIIQICIKLQKSTVLTSEIPFLFVYAINTTMKIHMTPRKSSINLISQKLHEISFSNCVEYFTISFIFVFILYPTFSGHVSAVSANVRERWKCYMALDKRGWSLLMRWTRQGPLPIIHHYFDNVIDCNVYTWS